MVVESRTEAHPKDAGGGSIATPYAGLVGREEELAELMLQLGRHRLVSVTGPGGVGKSSLATAAVGRLPFGDGVRVITCELADVVTEGAVRHAVAGALQVLSRPGEPIGGSLPLGEDGHRLLVLVDNCEHVLDAAAEVVEELLAAGPHVKVLATSRQPLEVAGEQVIVLGPLAVPASVADPAADTAPAVILFTRLAQAARVDFRLDAQTRSDVVRICRALDGVPLALEIAAARVRSLGVEELVDRLEQRFTLLRAGTRRTPDRHRSMLSVVEWSYGLLDLDEQTLFLALSAFPGGCDMVAATAAGVAAGLDAEEVVDLLDGLVAKSLITVTTSLAGTRYRMLETLRAFGLERLEAAGTLHLARDRHADYYAGVMREMRALGLRAWTQEMLPLLLELDNVRGALAWTLAEDSSADRSFDLLAPMWYLALQHHPGEIATLTDQALARWPDESHPRWSEVAGTLAQALVTLEDLSGARVRAESAVTATSSPVGAAFGWCALVAVARGGGDAMSALELLDRADAAAATAGFEPLRCDLMGRRATILAQYGRTDEALAAARRSLAMTREHANVYEHAWSQHLIGLLLAPDQPEAAEEWLSTALAESEASGYPYGTNSSLRGLGLVTAMQGDVPAAATYFSDAFTGFVRAGHLGERWNTVAALLPLLVTTGRREVAAALLVGADHAGAVLERIHAPLIDDVRADLAVELSSPRVIARGQALSPEQLFALARHELRLLRENVDAQPSGAQPPEAVMTSAREVVRPAELRRVGELWSATFAGATVHLPESKGLRDLTVLLAQPGREFAALDLASPAGATTGAAQAATARAEGLAAPSDLGEQLDARARAAYTGRIQELQEELDEADAAGDTERGARAQEELDFLTRELATAYGLHGPRRAGDPAEKARSAVTARIRSTIAKIREAHPALGTHLTHSIHTGRFCCYRPDEPTPWRIYR